MIDILDVEPGKSYGCYFRVETMLDTMGRPAPNLSDVPLKGPGTYESFGILVERDVNSRLVRVKDESSRKTFTVSFDDLWDIDLIEWTEPESLDG